MDGDATTSLGNLYLCLTTFIVEECSLNTPRIPPTVNHVCCLWSFCCTALRKTWFHLLYRPHLPQLYVEEGSNYLASDIFLSGPNKPSSPTLSSNVIYPRLLTNSVALHWIHSRLSSVGSLKLDTNIPEVTSSMSNRGKQSLSQPVPAHGVAPS